MKMVSVSISLDLSIYLLIIHHIGVLRYLLLNISLSVISLVSWVRSIKRNGCIARSIVVKNGVRHSLRTLGV